MFKETPEFKTLLETLSVVLINTETVSNLVLKTETANR